MLRPVWSDPYLQTETNLERDVCEHKYISVSRSNGLSCSLCLGTTHARQSLKKNNKGRQGLFDYHRGLTSPQLDVNAGPKREDDTFVF